MSWPPMTNSGMLALADRLEAAAKILSQKPCEVCRLQQDCEETSQALRLAAAHAADAPVEPVAWRLVPIEPDEKMRREGESAASFGIGKPHDDEAIRRVWQWMVRAAPQVSRDDSVAVPRADLKRVVEIAGRNEASPEIDRLRSILEAHKEPT